VRVLDRLRAWARELKRDVIALWLAARDPRTPLAAKLVAAAVSAYALSPIDLIPDVIPVLGLLDDLMIVPLGLMLAIRLIPPELMQEFRDRAAAQAQPVSRAGLVAVVVLWLVGALAVAWLGLAWLRRT
jgi:uncharacterized membrane protein YkvA (DUF1232 family)